MQDTSHESDLEGTYLHDCPSIFVLTDTTFQQTSQTHYFTCDEEFLDSPMILLGNMNNQYNNS